MVLPDKYFEAGSQNEQYEEAGLTAPFIEATMLKLTGRGSGQSRARRSTRRARSRERPSAAPAAPHVYDTPCPLPPLLSSPDRRWMTALSLSPPFPPAHMCKTRPTCKFPLGRDVAFAQIINELQTPPTTGISASLGAD